MGQAYHKGAAGDAHCAERNFCGFIRAGRCDMRFQGERGLGWVSAVLC